MISNFTVKPKVALQAEEGLGLIDLATVSDNETDDHVKRNYDYCSGVGFSGGANLPLVNRLGFRPAFRNGRLITLDGKNPVCRVLSFASASRLQWRKFFAAHEWGHFFSRSGYAEQYSERHTFKRTVLGYRFHL